MYLLLNDGFLVCFFDSSTKLLTDILRVKFLAVSDALHRYSIKSLPHSFIPCLKLSFFHKSFLP